MARLSIDKKYLAKAILLTLILVALYVTSVGVPGVTVPAVLVVAKKYGSGYGALISITAALAGLALSAVLSTAAVAVPGLGAGLAWLIFTYTFPW